MRIFAILDFLIPDILPYLREAQTLAASKGIELVVPGTPNGPQGIVWNEAVQAEIDRSDAVIGCVDLPNANVGYEIGYAFARGKPVALTRRCALLPDWLSQSPLKGVMCEQRETATQLVGLLETAASGRWLQQKSSPPPPHDQDRWKPGRFLCPGTAPFEIHQSCPTTWETAPSSPISLEALCEWATITPRAIWVIFKHDQGTAARDGDANAALSVIAGYYHGAGRSVDTFSHVQARDVVDLAQSARPFDTVADLNNLIRPLSNAVGNWKDHVDAQFISRWTSAQQNEAGQLSESDYYNPFIHTQRLYLLPEKSRAAFKHLHPGSLRAGRASESEAQFDTGRWTGIERRELVTNLCEAESGIDASITRLVLTADAGVGKTANVEWFLSAINSRPHTTAFAFDAADLAGITELDSPAAGTPTLVALLARQLMIAPHNADLTSEVGATVIRRLRDAGQLAILVDGLDQITSSAPLTVLRLLLNDGSWAGCRLIVAGRLHAVNQWRDALELAEDRHAWRFVRIGEFTEITQQQDFLGKEKFEALPPDTRTICQVPRVLEFMRLSTVKQIQELRTIADVVWNAAQALVKKSLVGTANAEDVASAADRRIGGDLEPGGQQQVQYVHALFAAIAYEMTSRTVLLDTEDDFHDRGEEVPNFSMIEVDRDFRQSVVRRIMPIIEDLGLERTEKEVVLDLDRLTALETVVDNVKTHVLFEQERHHLPDRDERLENVVWQNRTLQEFYVAYWLTRHATEDDSAAFADWIYYHEAIASDWYYFVNQFVAEMPAAAISAASWTATAANWYRPAPARSTEMLYRSWPTMMLMAGLPRLDWHDRGYRAGQNDKWLIPGTYFDKRKPKVCKLAQDVLKQYWGEFQSILADQTHPQHTTAKEFISDEFWSRIPGCEAYEMGLPIELQGTEPKLEAYYRAQVRRVCAGELTSTVAEDCVKPEWSVGRKGLVHRQDDLAWLIPILNECQTAVQGLTDAAEIERALQHAVDQIKDGWSKCDETPAEKMVAVDPFEMQTVPVIHRWFRMFYPRHKDAVRIYLADFDDERLESVSVPGEDHAAAYVSWYDAWAFCQWARWSVTNDSVGTVHYRCRLPHEAEWEYAARGDGPKHARYWWGDEFYEKIDSAEVERLSTSRAHADGRRGCTRNPVLNVDANSFGLKDVLGNVWEWTANPYEEVYRLGPTPGGQPAANHARRLVVRAGTPHQDHQPV